jgi:hypothetical protein
MGRDGTGRDGTGRDGTGRDGTGRDGTGREWKEGEKERKDGINKITRRRDIKEGSILKNKSKKEIQERRKGEGRMTNK